MFVPFQYNTFINILQLPEVTLEKPGPGESLPTDVTLVVETVSQDVHGEGRHAHVHLPAHQALLGRARAQTQVGLLVSKLFQHQSIK